MVLLSLCVYVALGIWLLQYINQMFKISRNAFLDMDICGNESLANMQEFTKINISNFSFIAGSLACKIIACALMLIHLLGLMSKSD